MSGQREQGMCCLQPAHLPTTDSDHLSTAFTAEAVPRIYIQISSTRQSLLRSKHVGDTRPSI